MSTATATENKSESKTKAIEAGAKFTGVFMNPDDLHIIGLDQDAPGPDAHPILHRCYQPERLADIERKGVGDLQATIEAVDEVIVPIDYVQVKLQGEVTNVVVFGRRRVLAARAINKVRKGNPILVKAIRHDAADPALWLKVRSENAGRAEESPLAVAADIKRMLAGDEKLGLKAMSHNEIGALYGKNHQWSRAMLNLEEAADNVKRALRQGKLSQTAAQLIASNKDHAEQEKLLETALAEGGTAKAAQAASATAKGSKAKAKVGWTTSQIREARRGLESEMSKLEERRGNKVDAMAIIAAHAALSIAIGEEPMVLDFTKFGFEEPEDGGDSVADTAYLLVDNAREPGAALLEADKSAASEAEKAEKQAAAEAEKAKAKAEKDKEKADKKAAKEKEKADKIAAKLKAAADKEAEKAKKAADKTAAEAAKAAN